MRIVRRGIAAEGDLAVGDLQVDADPEKLPCTRRGCRSWVELARNFREQESQQWLTFHAF